jgi:hypothetical protein
MDWGAVVPGALLVANIGMVYASLNPAICVVAAGYFAVAKVVYTYNFMFVYSKPFEMGGLMWPIICRRVIIGLGLSQVRACVSTVGVFAMCI